MIVLSLRIIRLRVALGALGAAALLSINLIIFIQSYNNCCGIISCLVALGALEAAVGAGEVVEDGEADDAGGDDAARGAHVVQEGLEVRLVLLDHLQQQQRRHPWCMYNWCVPLSIGIWCRGRS